MPSSRQRLHTRTITLQGYRLDDGRYELEGSITDVKDADYQLASGLRRAGDPVHAMTVCVRFNADYVIEAVAAQSDRVPYTGSCDTIGPAYRQLVGLCLLRGFRKALMDRMGGVAGCSHMTELLSVFPTAALQMRSGEIDETQGRNGQQPFQLEKCHALQVTGETVQKYYPRWYKSLSAHPEPSPQSANALT